MTPALTLMAAWTIGLSLATAVVLHPAGPGRRGSLRAQVTSWWYLCPPLFLAWALYPWGASALVMGVGLLAARELRGQARAPQTATVTAGLVLGLLAEAAALALPAGAWGAAVAATVAGLLLAVAATARRGSGPGPGPGTGPGLGRPVLLLGLFASQAAGLLLLPQLAPAGAAPGQAAAWFLFLALVTMLNDIGQFLSGSSLGRHKLSPRISPNKTWQGLAGGLVVSAAVAVAAGRDLGLAAGGAPLGMAALAGLGLLLSLAGLLGDLFFSAGKRALGIKDYSALIPGHGGVLDRVDSLVLTTPLLWLLLRLA